MRGHIELLPTEDELLEAEQSVDTMRTRAQVTLERKLVESKNDEEARLYRSLLLDKVKLL